MEKKKRGKPLGSLKANARRVSVKIRWTDEEINEVKVAANLAGEDFSNFVRTASLERCRKI